MTPEETIDQQIWGILQDIKAEILAQEGKDVVRYRLLTTIQQRNIPDTKIRDILYNLEAKGIFKIHRNERGQRIGDGLKFYLIINPLKFEENYKKYQQLNSLQETSLIVKIDYNKESGIGYVNNAKRFKFKDHQPEYRLFPVLYERINRKLLRKDVLSLIGFNKSGFKAEETYEINELVTKIRKRTGLNKDQLANNNGDLTLVGEKVKKSTVNLP